MYKSLKVIYIALVLFIAAAMPAPAQEAPKAGGQPILLIDGAWNPSPGAWGLYEILDKKKGQTSLMHFATMERGDYEGQVGRWIEITIENEEAGTVVTRVLMEESKAGPTKVLRAIVQPEGYSPFYIPDSMLEDSQEGVEDDFKPIEVNQKVKEVSFKYKGKKYPAWKVKGKDNAGQPITATVSEYAPPLGLISAETADVKMKCKKFGTNAKSGINGEPMNFYLWITSQVADALSKSGEEQ